MSSSCLLLCFDLPGLPREVGKVVNFPLSAEASPLGAAELLPTTD